MIAYWFLRTLIALLQALPLAIVARLGRAGGALAWALRLRHRRIALQNLAAAFPEKPAGEILGIARENMLRIGENYASAIKTSSMSTADLERVCEVAGLGKLPDLSAAGAPKNCIVAIGHFGNFELYTRLGQLLPGARPATTYRGLKHPRLSGLMQQLRARSGCRFYERRSDAAALKEALNQGGLLLGLLADQHVSGGIWAPFMGRSCFTSPAPALFALRYDAPLFTAICRRTAPGRWRIEVGDEIPVRIDGETREAAAITADMNRAFEAALRTDPANWFWVHNRWKPNPRAPEKSEAPPAAASKADPVPP